MEVLTRWIQKTIGLNPEIQIKILSSLLITLFLWLFYSLIIKIVWRRTENARIRYNWKKTSGYIVLVFSVF